eukprot:SAG31_NODE_4614_length_3095_cov_76.629172_4_plen_49_part_00
MSKIREDEYEVVLTRGHELKRIALPLPKSKENEEQWGDYYDQVAPELP